LCRYAGGAGLRRAARVRRRRAGGRHPELHGAAAARARRVHALLARRVLPGGHAGRPRDGRAGATFHSPRYFAVKTPGQNTAQLMTAGIVHVTSLIPGSDSPTRWARGRTRSTTPSAPPWRTASGQSLHSLRKRMNSTLAALDLRNVISWFQNFLSNGSTRALQGAPRRREPPQRGPRALLHRRAGGLRVHVHPRAPHPVPAQGGAYKFNPVDP
jgi:hypothetical protein